YFMIKGINKQVLEVLETNNGYFEKALFFIKPEFSGISENKLRELALTEIKSAINPPKQKYNNKTNKLLSFIYFFAVFISGLILGILLSFLI
ncbi:MAG: hypothetical protein IJN49_03565, partial [Clostridia bacterium]|nr:hypothetical protein [Clostridia bacterium]